MRSDLIFYSHSKWVIFRHHSCILIYHSRFHTLSPLQYYGRKTSPMHVDLLQSLPYIITSSIIWKKNIIHAYWFTTVPSVHYHLVNNMEEKHRSCILIYHSHLNKLSPLTHYHLLSNAEEKHRSCIFEEEKHRSCIFI